MKKTGKAKQEYLTKLTEWLDYINEYGLTGDSEWMMQDLLDTIDYAFYNGYVSKNFFLRERAFVISTYKAYRKDELGY